MRIIDFLFRFQSLDPDALIDQHSYSAVHSTGGTDNSIFTKPFGRCRHSRRWRALLARQ